MGFYFGADNRIRTGDQPPIKPPFYWGAPKAESRSGRALIRAIADEVPL